MSFSVWVCMLPSLTALWQSRDALAGNGLTLFALALCVLPMRVHSQCLVAAKDLLHRFDSECLYTEEPFPVAAGG